MKTPGPNGPHDATWCIGHVITLITRVRHSGLTAGVSDDHPHRLPLSGVSIKNRICAKKGEFWRISAGHFSVLRRDIRGSGGREGGAKMPKKMGTNSKAEAARTRKSEAESERKERAAREKEEQYWKEAEGSKSRAAKKREDEAEKRAEIAARKAENRKIAEMEQQEIERAMRKPDKKAGRVSIPVPKVTEADLQRRREEEHLRLQREAETAKKKQIRTTEEEEYERMVLVSNTNRDDSLIEAHSVEEAIVKISLAEPAVLADRHPERRLKASFKVTESVQAFSSRSTADFFAIKKELEHLPSYSVTVDGLVSLAAEFLRFFSVNFILTFDWERIL